MSENNNKSNEFETISTHFNVVEYVGFLKNIIGEVMNQWLEIVNKNIPDLLEALLEQDLDKVEKEVSRLKEKTSKILKEDRTSTYEEFADKIAEIYKIGFIEGSTDNVKCMVKIFKDLIESGAIQDEDFRIRMLLKTMTETAEESQSTYLPGEMYTFVRPADKDFPPNSPKV